MINSLLVNIPPMTPDAQAAAAALFPQMVSSGVELTLTQIAPEQFAASYLTPLMTVPIAVVGLTMADCLTQIATRVLPPPPPVEETEGV